MTKEQELKIINVGLVMPIAPIDNCSADHWLEVKGIISESLTGIPGYKFETKIVSESNSIGLIHKRIVQGLYNSDIVICDVSCKNPNVMFELGMRLAFDKPTIIIKDDQTDYSFDTSGIEHVTYPRDLRFKKIIEFKSILAVKTTATYEDSISNSGHSTFLKSFGEFKAVTINSTEVSPNEMMLELLTELQTDISELKRNSNFKITNDQKREEPFSLKTSLYRDSILMKSIDSSITSYLGDYPMSVDDINLDQLIEFSTEYLFKRKIKLHPEKLKNLILIILSNRNLEILV